MLTVCIASFVVLVAARVLFCGGSLCGNGTWSSLCWLLHQLCNRRIEALQDGDTADV